MKIAIIGGGWLGCHIGAKLQHKHDISIFEKSGLFAGSSFLNQNRLHKGFHYSRNQKTRRLCYNTFDLFLQDYSHLVENIPYNYYAIPYEKSLVDFGTYKSIYYHEEIPFAEQTPNFLHNIEGCLVVDERYINPVKAKEHFDTILGTKVITQEIYNEDLPNLSKEYDLVLDVTNNMLRPAPDHYYELSLTLIYDRLPIGEFGSLTMVDGPLFSIYPYRENEYTVTDVEYTPMYTSLNVKDLLNYKSTINADVIKSIRSKVESKILLYYGAFKTHFTYKDYYTSIKVKRFSDSADRSPTILQNNNIISCNTGKIQGIYILENYIQNEITDR